MRFRLLLLFLPLLLGACSKVNAPVRLDFIGTTTLTSGSKVVNPNDTLTTRVYAVGNDNALQRLRIVVNYEPGLKPIIYPSPISNYDPKNAPGSLEVVWLDSLIKPVSTSANGHSTSEYVFANKFTARSTSGTERWQYTASDGNNESASRAYLLTTRKADSAAAFHSYTTLLRAVPKNAVRRDSLRQAARVFLNLHYGLLLPKYAITTQKVNQALIDVVGTTDGLTFALSTPAVVSSVANWPLNNRRPTELRSTALTPATFASATAPDFETAFSGGREFAANRLSTGTLAKNQVVAFRVVEENASYYGLLLVSDLVLGTAPVLTCSVKVQK